MKKLLVVLFLSQFALLHGQDQKAATLRSILLEQLRSTHHQKEWFVPVDVAVEGLTAKQAAWKDKSGNHSINELVNHLTFWNQRQLEKFKGQKSAPFDGNNEETFNKSLDSAGWAAAVEKLDAILTEWERAVEQADEHKLQSWASTIAHIGAHNAYHIGQIVQIRRLQGAWDPEKGVKS